MTTVRVTKKKTKKTTKVVRVLLLRHAKTGHNALGIIQGQLDTEVNLEGSTQIEGLRETLQKKMMTMPKKKYSEDFYVGFTEMFGDGSRNDDDENDDDDDENHRNSKVTRTTRGYFARVRTENGTDSIPRGVGGVLREQNEKR